MTTPTYEQIDEAAKILARADGISPDTWAAMDECQRTRYRLEAVLRERIEYLVATLEKLLPVAERGYAEHPTQENGEAIRSAAEAMDRAREWISKQRADPNH